MSFEPGSLEYDLSFILLGIVMGAGCMAWFFFLLNGVNHGCN